MEKDSRIEWVDLLKGIAILWLVVYHMYLFGWMRSPVPVFFFLSGLFFSEGKSFASFVVKKAKALLIPLLFFFLLGVAASALKCFLQGEAYSFPPLWLFATLISADAEVTNPLGVGAIWFLVSLFEIYIIYFLLRLVSKSNWWLITASVLLLLFSIVMRQSYASGSLFYLFSSCGFVIYFAVAHILREKVLFGKIPVWFLFISVLAYVVRFIDISNLLSDDTIGGGGLLRVRGIISMSGLIIMLVWLCKQLSLIKPLSNSKVYSFMLFEGRNSVTILGTHLLAMGVVAILLKHFMTEGILYYFILFIVVVAICNICIVLFNRFVPFLVNHKS